MSKAPTHLVGNWISRAELPALLEEARRIYQEVSMPVQRGKSGLLAKYGAKLATAQKKHAHDETDAGFIRLPGGINNGVAKLTKCGFEQYKQGSNMKTADGKSAVGEYYFMAEGVVVSPEFVQTENGPQKVAGLQTRVMEPLCDTKTQAGKVTTTDEHVAEILNHFRLLGYPAEGLAEADLEEVAAQLKEAAPYFKFTTSQSKATKEFPDPRVWENWHGTAGLEAYEAAGSGEPAPDTQDNSGGTEVAGGEPPDDGDKATANGTDPDADGALSELAEKADGGDRNAMKQLEEVALQYGVSAEEVANAQNWTEVVSLIQAIAGVSSPNEEEAQEPAEEPEPEPETPKDPEKGDMFKYHPIDPRTKKPALNKLKKPLLVEVEVLLSDKKSRTATVKNADDGKTLYKNVKWDALIPQ